MTTEEMMRREVRWYRKHGRWPVALMEWCLQMAQPTLPILDPYMGSGTTLVAAKLRGLKAVGIEINEDYCKIAVERLRQGVLIAV